MISQSKALNGLKNLILKLSKLVYAPLRFFLFIVDRNFGKKSLIIRVKQYHFKDPSFVILIFLIIATLFLGLNPNFLRFKQNKENKDLVISTEKQVEVNTRPDLLHIKPDYNQLFLSATNIFDVSGQYETDFSGVFFVVDETGLKSLSIPTIYPINFSNRSTLMTYKVKEGDSPSKIAQAFGISVETLLFANNLTNFSSIKPGQELIVLPISGVKHEVKSGDTISSLAKKYKVKTEDILSFNNMPKDIELVVGQTLIIPGAAIPITQGARVVSNLPAVQEGFLIYPTTGWNWGRLHYNNAVDIANQCGTPVYAAASGLVIDRRDTGWNSGAGKLVKVQHQGGLSTNYFHLGEILVNIGNYVEKGQVIARIGNTGNTHGPTGCHLHFEVRGARNPFAFR